MSFRSFNSAQIDFMRTLREAGATSPESAFTIDRNSPVSPEEIEELIEVEAIARVAPYQYHIRPQSRHAKLLAAMDKGSEPDTGPAPTRIPWTPARMAKTMSFWTVLILVPILLLQLCKPR
jgi:hypothetical protein